MFSSLALFIFSATESAAQTVSVKDTVMTTYPYSDPDPVPNPGKIYPYWKFRQFSITPEQRSWKMVVLENDYLRVKVFPEIGGKVWSIYDKTAGKEMFYDNDVVKFREIALRGPWTSGGIEFNYGVIGHAPSCSSPVDWHIETKDDGSVSCYIGVFELASRSRWTIEINLPKDAVWVRTSSVWHNGSPEYQPYYNWANSAVKVADDLVLVYPAENAVGHSGEHLKYPVDDKGRDLSRFANQAFGADKSYHMVGSHKPFFGAYYSGEDWGVLHYARRDEKLGRKYFCWAQSDQGNIWIDLLTDGRPQYVEMQSGRLFNQNVLECSQRSSYRQVLFTPYGTDCWSEYWLPFAGIGPADDVNLHAVTSVVNENGKTKVGIYPLTGMDGEFTASDAEGKIISRKKLALSPAKSVNIEFKGKAALLKLGDVVLWRSENGRTDRPQNLNGDFDPKSSSGRLLLARDMMGMRMFDKAEPVVDTVLMSEPGNIDALAMKANLLFRRMCYKEALAFSDKALSIDQYNPDAGYAGGLACAALGRIPEAMDRFEVAAISNSPIRSAACTELARLHFSWGDRDMAADYARKALVTNSANITAISILCKAGGCSPDEISSLTPLCHFPDAEKFLSGAIDAAAFASTFKEELPWEDYMELACFYNSLGLKDDAVKVLEALPEQNVLTALWTAYLKGDAKLVSKAEKCSIDYVFPFRRESSVVLDWALGNGGGWKCAYLSAMLKDYFGDKAAAAALMDRTDTGFAPYDAYRYSFTKDIEDIRRAISIDPSNWMYLRLLSDALVAGGRAAEVIPALESYYSANVSVFQIGDALVDAYIAEGRYKDAEAIVDSIVYLPFEGQRNSHEKYSYIKLRLAAEAVDSGKLDVAEKLVEEALLWPARLGAGKPYDDMINTDREQWLRKEIEARRNGNGPFEPVTPKIENNTIKDKYLF